MSNSGSFVMLTIPTTEMTNSDIGLLDILHIVRDSFVDELVWGIERIECTGPDAQVFLDKLDASPGGRLLIDNDDLLKLASTCEQIIDGTFLHYPPHGSAQAFKDEGRKPISCASSTDEIAKNAVHGDRFDENL